MDSSSPLLEEEGIECVSNESRTKKEEKKKRGYDLTILTRESI